MVRFEDWMPALSLNHLRRRQHVDDGTVPPHDAHVSDFSLREAYSLLESHVVPVFSSIFAFAVLVLYAPSHDTKVDIHAEGCSGLCLIFSTLRSFGSYFKEEAIGYAWECLTKVSATIRTADLLNGCCRC